LVASVDDAANGAGMLPGLQLNERAYLISLLATISAPLTFLTGFFGRSRSGWLESSFRSRWRCCAGVCWRSLSHGRCSEGGPPA
jgi:hypothetical protein